MIQFIDEIRLQIHGITPEQAFNKDNWIKGQEYAPWFLEARKLYEEVKE